RVERQRLLERRDRLVMPAGEIERMALVGEALDIGGDDRRGGRGLRGRTRRARPRRGQEGGRAGERGFPGEIAGEAGIRTLDTGFGPYSGLANRRLQPLGHLTAREVEGLAARTVSIRKLRRSAELRTLTRSSYNAAPPIVTRGFPRTARSRTVLAI